MQRKNDSTVLRRAAYPAKGLALCGKVCHQTLVGASLTHHAHSPGYSGALHLVIQAGKAVLPRPPVLHLCKGTCKWTLMFAQQVDDLNVDNGIAMIVLLKRRKNSSDPIVGCNGRRGT